MPFKERAVTPRRRIRAREAAGRARRERSCEPGVAAARGVRKQPAWQAGSTGGSRRDAKRRVHFCGQSLREETFTIGIEDAENVLGWYRTAVLARTEAH